MGRRIQKRFSISSLLLFTASVAILIWWLQAPDRTASKLAVAIENKDREGIRRFCTSSSADLIIRELDRNPYEESYTADYLATIRHTLPKYEPNPKCTIISRGWRQILGQSKQLKLRLNDTTFILMIRGTRAVDVEEKHEIISFTFPLIR